MAHQIDDAILSLALLFAAARGARFAASHARLATGAAGAWSVQGPRFTAAKIMRPHIIIAGFMRT